MIKRVAMWRLKNKEDSEKMKGALESMRGNVPSLLDFEVGINISESSSSFDIVFIATFEDKDALSEFRNDKFHMAVDEVVGKFREQRVVVDFNF